MLPEMWLLPREEAYGPGLRSGRVQVAVARGNADLHLGATELGLRRLEAGVVAAAGLGASPSVQEVEDDEATAVDVPNVVAFSAVPVRVATTVPARAATTTTTWRPSTTVARMTTTRTTAARTTTTRTTAAPRAATTRASSTSSGTRTASQQKGSTAVTGRDGTTAPPRPTSDRIPPAPTRASTSAGGSPTRSSGGTAAPAGSSASSTPARSAAQTGGNAGARGSYPSPPMHSAPVTPAQLRTTAPPFVGFWPDGGGDYGDSGWPTRSRSRRALASGSGYKGPSRKEVSRTELPGRPWSSGFHNYTLRWTPGEPSCQYRKNWSGAIHSQSVTD